MVMRSWLRRPCRKFPFPDILRPEQKWPGETVPFSAAVDTFITIRSPCSPPIAPYRFQLYRSWHLNDERLVPTIESVMRELSNKMKRSLRSVCLLHASGWPGYATIQPRRRRLRPRLHTLLTLSSSTSRPSNRSICANLLNEQYVLRLR
jgi:hypothetical protein